jgi:hypothetical protein
VLAETDKPIVPLVLPLCPETIAIQPLSLNAAQPQPLAVPTPTETDPPADPMRSLLRLSAKRHAAADSLSVTVCPATFSAPARATGTVFGATR